MSYNTRRNYVNNPVNPGLGANVGQRRTGGFVSGGQLAGSQPQYRPQGQQQQRPALQQQPGNVRNQPTKAGQAFISQASTPQKQQQVHTGYTPVKQEPQSPAAASTLTKPVVQQQQNAGKPIAQQQQTPLKPVIQTPVVQTPVVQAPKPVVQQQQAPADPAGQQQLPSLIPLTAVTPSSSNPEPMDVADNSNKNAAEGTRKKFWPKGTANKISRAEKARRRNLKLSKILQPKNAVMILNELIKGCDYNVEEVPVKIDVNQFRGTVSFDGLEFAGTGKNKIAAKNSAAETALKHLVKNKKIGTTKKEEDSEKMEIGEEEGQQVMPWSHIASFAMYKLFSAWGEDPNTVKVCEENPLQDLQGNSLTGPTNPVARDPKPAKKMPDNPETLNPLMLMHQMLPGAVWEEVGKTGNPPNIIFQMKVTIGDKSFIGTGSNKKTAKRVAAFSACHELLDVTYPSEVWMPFY